MKNFIWALFVSIVVHFLLLYNFKNIENKQYKPSPNKKISPKYTYIQLASIKEVKKTQYKKVKPIKKRLVKQVVKKQKKIIKKKKIKKKVKKKIYKKVIKKSIKPAKRKSVFIDEYVKKKKEIKQNIKKLELLKKQLQKERELKEIKHLDKLTQSYIKLYGEKYFRFSQEVKKYLKENLNEIGRITQQYLRYPSIAVRTRQQGTSFLEFVLKPNGDIINLKIIQGSSYRTLDKNSIKTIKIAYKDYPRPKKDTLIRIYVSYILY